MGDDEYKKLMPRFQHGKILSANDIAQIEKLHLQGLSLRKIAKQFKVSHQTVQRVLKQEY
ncbi:helix-turn-helix domain-containing protein [Clostridium sp. WILCCON 0269]|uniref:Helix-turn-helix domain-containing protein n=1 Tax=Candidatus Clostridium eludens TaxID=3381663 RepID=A0ABW8SR56_9CLOT